MTPTCDAVRSYLAAHVDGEATPLGTEAMAAHLQGGEDCAAAAAELRAYREAMARAYRQAGAEAVEGFRKCLLGVINEEDRRKVGRPVTAREPRRGG
jgi:anti-sigma factor RsiW